MDTSRLGPVIRGLRKRKGLTAAELGRRVGVSGKQIEHIEAGRRGAPLKRLDAIATALGYDLQVSIVPAARELDEAEAALLTAIVEHLPTDPARWGILRAQVDLWKAETDGKPNGSV